MEARNFNYMVYGFSAAWLILLIYVITIAVRERNLRQELDRVKRLLSDAARTSE
ncbi:MAG: CcmD family protein [Acidobacteriota bacterium]|jgi:CcmD family protein|nr:CcmD family protein [Acidobacteriota bacterium]